MSPNPLRTNDAQAASLACDLKLISELAAFASGENLGPIAADAIRRIGINAEQCLAKIQRARQPALPVPRAA